MTWYAIRTTALCIALLVAVVEKTAASKASELYMKCCDSKKGTDEECKQKLCTFEITSDQIFAFYPHCSRLGDTMSNIWSCATANQDHRRCCKKRHVPRICQFYCNGKESSNRVDPGCMLFLDQIRGCFKEYYEEQ